MGLGCCSVIHLLHMLAASRRAQGLPMGERGMLGCGNVLSTHMSVRVHAALLQRQLEH